MNFHTRKWVKPEDLNPNGTLFGGSLLRWIDEEAAIYAIVQLGNQRVVTKYISEINFVSASRQGDIIELGITATEFGRTSITLTCEVRNKITRKSILTVERWSSSTSVKTACRRRTGAPRSSTSKTSSRKMSWSRSETSALLHRERARSHTGACCDLWARACSRKRLCRHRRFTRATNSREPGS
jgi:acyl-CoA hydrolase